MINLFLTAFSLLILTMIGWDVAAALLTEPNTAANIIGILVAMITVIVDFYIVKLYFKKV